MCMPGMSEASMRALSAQYFATHPAHGMVPASATVAAADTFFASGVTFNADGNLGTQVDTSFITTGQTVLWKWVSGLHTVTSGDVNDPLPGSLFDSPLDSLHPEYAFTFLTAGTYPFQCVFHAGFFNMVGYVVVTDPAGVQPVATRAGLGFTTSPWPNPSASGVRFRFAVSQAGRARVAVYDAAGRTVAGVFDQQVAPGTYESNWDGRGDGGRRIQPGNYYLRLTAPGVSQSRRVTISR
jgi:plastocyanin